MKSSKWRVRMILISILLGLFTLALWDARPMPQRVQDDTVNGVRYHVERAHYWTSLPRNEWGVGRFRETGCGPNGGVQLQTRKFGFFAIVDRTATEFHRLK